MSVPERLWVNLKTLYVTWNYQENPDLSGKTKIEKQCPLKNNFYFELHCMIIFYSYVFDWLFGLSFHKFHEWMECNMDVNIR